MITCRDIVFLSVHYQISNYYLRTQVASNWLSVDFTDVHKPGKPHFTIELFSLDYWMKQSIVPLMKKKVWRLHSRLYLYFKLMYAGHSSLVDYLAQVIYAKNCPTSFYCIFRVVWVPMTTTQNIRVCFLSSNNKLFS